MADKKDVAEEVDQCMSTMNVPLEDVEHTTIFLHSMLSHPAFDNPRYKWSLDNFELGSRLGRGKFGRVFIAKIKETDYIVALKTLSKKEIVESHVEQQVLREIEIQTHLNHPNILQMLTYFHDDFRIYLVLEYAGHGEIYRHLKSQRDGYFTEHDSAKYIYQVADAVNYCHLNKVIHRDIKPENLLLSITYNIKLSDFGWSVHAPSSDRKTMCGTLDYLPPEIVEGRTYGPDVDNWCLGILVYEFLVGRPPFESSDSEQTYKRIKAVDLIFPDHVTHGARDLISKLLRRSSHQRMHLVDVMKHPWVVANR